MITTLSSKLTSRTKFDLKQYPRKAYLDKVNPEFIEFSKKNIEKKKQRMKIKSWKTQMSHQLSTVKKINQKIQRDIKKQRGDLMYLKKVQNRVQNDKAQKQRLNLFKMQENEKKRYRSYEARKSLKQRNEYSKNEYSFVRKLITQNTKRESEIFQKQRRKAQVENYYRNRSMVSRIQQQKRKGRQSVNSFHRRKNSESVCRLSRSIQKYNRQALKDQEKIHQIEYKYKSQAKKKQQLAIQLQNLKSQMETLSNSYDASRITTKRSLSLSTVQNSRILNQQLNSNLKQKFSLYCGGGLYKYNG